MKHQNDEQGIVLILSLVMTMVLLGVSTVLATLAIREARVAGSVGQGLTAYYDSESAVEATIYEISKLGSEPETLDGGGGTSPSGGTWGRSVITETDEFIFDFLPAGALRSIDLYNRDNANGAANVSGLSLNWTSGSELRVDLQEWDGSTLSGPTSNTYTCQSSPCSASVVLNSGMAYKVDFFASGTSVSDLFITTSPSGTLVDLPTTVVVTSEFAGTRQAVELTLPVPPPWSVPPAECGDGAVEGAEECDDGNLDDGDGCSATCLFESTCGNSVTEAGEDCDDGNVDDGDGCSSLCQLEPPMCGNGTIELAEECDDGNTVSGDGCSSICEDEVAAVCGDGVQEGSEQCDDGNTADGDGCDSSCNLEMCTPEDGGWSAWSWGSCSQSCGSGIQNGSRTCDNPAPSCGGADCVGSSTATQTCNNNYCTPADIGTYAGNFSTGLPTDPPTYCPGSSWDSFCGPYTPVGLPGDFGNWNSSARTFDFVITCPEDQSLGFDPNNSYLEWDFEEPRITQDPNGWDALTDLSNCTTFQSETTYSGVSINRSALCQISYPASSLGFFMRAHLECYYPNLED